MDETLEEMSARWMAEDRDDAEDRAKIEAHFDREEEDYEAERMKMFPPA